MTTLTIAQTHRFTLAQTDHTQNVAVTTTRAQQRQEAIATATLTTKQQAHVRAAIRHTEICSVYLDGSLMQVFTFAQHVAV
jgi:hypothetical protein